MHSLMSRSAEDTQDLALRLAAIVGVADVILLEGDIGAGKSLFARTMIQELLAEPEDVPSPTFTLVQIYDAPDFEIWHSDLYRLTSPDEVVELGLTEAFETALCLVEWPDRLAELTPADALKIQFELGKDEGQRQITLHWTDPKWGERMKKVMSQ